jgi:hypothetical protein
MKKEKMEMVKNKIGVKEVKLNYGI